MSDFKKNILNSFYTVFKYKKHSEQKEQLLSLIQHSSGERLERYDSYYDDFINKLDWSDRCNPNREWVKLLLSGMSNELFEIVYSLGYNDIFIRDIWFQQYVNNSTHGWHTHGCNVTGVYYLEMDINSPKTQLICPWSSQLIIPNITEGDVIIFPSYVVHRAPIVLNNKRKTIISFNADYGNPSEEFVSYLTNNYN